MSNETIPEINSGWKEQSGSTIWLPENDNDSITGIVEAIEQGMYGVQLVLKTADGSVIRTPSHKVLQNRLSAVKVGDVVRIVYTGTEPPSVKGQNPTKMYTVYIKEE